jgi:hypothetical protein
MSAKKKRTFRDKKNQSPRTGEFFYEADIDQNPAINSGYVRPWRKSFPETKKIRRTKVRRIVARILSRSGGPSPAALELPG